MNAELEQHPNLSWTRRPGTRRFAPNFLARPAAYDKGMFSRLSDRVVTLLALVLGAWCSMGFAQTQQPVRVVIVGLEHGHVAGFLPQFPKEHDVELVGIVDADAALREKYEQEFHLDHALFFSKLDEAIAIAHPQALLVYTPIGEHRWVIEAAAAKGLDVMVEKPLTLSLDDALAIRKAAREHHIQVLVNYETTWYASNRAIYEMVQQGRLGDLRKVVVHDGHQGPQEIGVQPEFLEWLTDPVQNGAGALYDFGCYGADLMTWLMHGEAPLSVTAVAQTDKPEKYPHVDDDATIILRYPRTQAVLMPSWNWTFARKDTEVYGTLGYAIAVNPTQVRTRFSEKAPEETTTAAALAPPEDTSLHYLAAVLRGELKPQGDLTALDTNVVVMQILDAARESAHTGKTVEVKPLPQ
jgi:glucose-fructose oxidoreductase